MNRLVSWEFYSSLYDDIGESEFEKSEIKAEQEVRAVIGPLKWDAITEETFGYEVLKDCICKVMNQQKCDAKTGLGKGITSVSNDGYSETFAKANAEDVRAGLHISIKQWLSGTGLVGAY